MVVRPRTLRVRLALAFGFTSTILAAGFGTLLLHQARLQLAHGIDEGIIPVATELAGRVQAGGPDVIAGSLPELRPPSDAFAQVVDAGGRILATSEFPGNDRPLLPPGDAGRAAATDRRVHRQIQVDGRDGGNRSVPARLLAFRVATGDRTVVLVTATSFDEARGLEDDLERELTVGLPILAGTVALGGWLLTGAMFKPVRSMIEQADTISAREPGERLEIASGGAELVVLASRLNAMLDRIEDATARERAFLDDASHELRTPISIVRGELELARAQADGHPELVESLDSVLDEVERLERLAHNLLVLARSRSGSLTAGDTPVDLETVVDRAVRDVSRRAGNHHVAIRRHGNAVVNGDELALQRAVLNLLDNAVRYAATEVSVTIDAHPSVVAVTVVDDGPGFGEVLPQAFDRFTRDPGQGGGMGLGLAITAAIVTAHGGYVSADNRPAGGAEVCVRLPAA